jgi:hypothetical protein
MARLRFRNIVCFGLVVLASCVVRLKDRNSPAENGAVTGPPADCAVERPPPRGEIGGAAELKFVGRYDFTDPAKPIFDWSGNYIEARFEGATEVAVGLEHVIDPPSEANPNPQPYFDARFTAVVDGREPFVFYVTVDPVTYEPIKRHVVASGHDPAQAYSIKIHRDTEPQSGGIMRFTGLDLGAGRLLPPVRRARRIEMIGDSITCGYGNEGPFATCPYDVDFRKTRPDGNGNQASVRVPKTENQYASYGAIAARELDADVVTVCWSGRGVSRNYKDRPPEVDPNTRMLVPEAWAQRTIGNEGPPKRPAWDFASEPQPQVVVINLGTNDFARDQSPDPLPECAYLPQRTPGCLGAYDPATTLVTTIPGDNLPDRDLVGDNLERFFQKFLDLTVDVRAKRPDAHIFLAVPPMITDQFPDDDARQNHRRVLQRIVDARIAAGDVKVYAMELVEQGTRYGLGCDYHPNLEVHRIMATQLVGAIRYKTCW